MKLLRIVLAALFMVAPVMAQRFVKVANTYAELSALNVADVNTNCFVAGRTAVGDGGEGTFTYSRTSTATVDSGTILTAAGGTGRWLRQDTDVINPQWWGAATNASANNAAIISAFSAASARGGGRVRLPAGNYNIDGAPNTTWLKVPSNVIFEGDGPATVIAVKPNPTDNSAAINFSQVSKAGLRNMTLACTQTGVGAFYEYGVYVFGATDILIENVNITTPYTDGITVTAGFPASGTPPSANVTIRNVNVTSARRNGISIVDCDTFLLERCIVTDTGGGVSQTGIDIEPDSAYHTTHGSVVDCIVRRSVGVGLYINLGSGGLAAGNNASAITVRGCSLENNSIGVAVDSAWNVNLLANNVASNTSHGINLNVAYETLVRGNTVSTNTGRGIYVSSGGRNNEISGNFVLGNGDNGIEVVTANDAAADFVRIEGNTTKFNAGSGIEVRGYGHLLSLNNCISNSLHGININYADSCSVNGNQLQGNSQGADNTYNGVILQNGSSYNHLIGNTARHSPRYQTGTATAGGASSITLSALASSFNGYYNSLTVYITGGTGNGQSSYVSAYDGATKVATVATPWGVVPDATSVYEVRSTKRQKYGVWILSDNGNVVLNNDWWKGGAISDGLDSGTNNQFYVGTWLEYANGAFLKKASNLSDVASVATSRSNLGLGSMALQNSNDVNITGGKFSGLTNSSFGTAASLTFENNTAVNMKSAGGTSRDVLKKDASENVSLRAYDSGDISIDIAASSTSAIKLKSTGVVGIGTSSPGAKLDVLRTGASGSQLRLSSDAGNFTDFTTTLGGHLTIAPSGNDTEVIGTLTISGGTTVSDVAASSILRTDGVKKLSAATIGSGLSFDGTTLSATATGTAGTVINSGASSTFQVPVYYDTSGTNVTPKSILAGSNITITTNASGFTIDATISGVGGGNLQSTGASTTNKIPVYSDTTGTNVAPKTLTAGSNITITQDATSLTIAASGGSGTVGTVINTGASAVSQVPRYTDTTGTNVAPSSVTIDGSGNVVANSLTMGTTNVVGALAGKQPNFTTGVGVTNISTVLSGNYSPGANVTFTTNSNGNVTIAASGSGGGGNLQSTGSSTTNMIAVYSDTSGTNVVPKTLSAGSNITITQTSTNLSIAGAGSVSSVAVDVTSYPEVSVSGSPITSSGTFTFTKATQTSNTFWAGPTSGAAAAPTFRAFNANDIPNGQIVATTKLSATGTPDATTFLRGDNTWATPGGGGTITGSGTTGTIPKFTGATAIGDGPMSVSSTTNVLTTGAHFMDSGYFTNGATVGSVTKVTALTVVETGSGDPRGIMSAQYSGDALAPRFHTRKSRGTQAAPTIITTGDLLGQLRFSGYDGSSYLQDASIDIGSIGTIAATRVPTYMAFSTATDVAPSVLTERMRILPAGNVLIGTTTSDAGLLEVLSTTQQASFAYDSTHRMNLTVDSSGNATVGLTGGTQFAVPNCTFFTTGDVRLGSAVDFYWSAGTHLKSSSSGVLMLQDNAGTSFNRLQFGGTTASFPSIKRNTTGLDIRLADDSAYAAVNSLYVRNGSGSPESSVTAGVGSIYSRTDGGTWTSLYVKESGSGNTGWQPVLSGATQSANTILAGPTSGAAAAPTFRALVAADIPSGIPFVKTALIDFGTATNVVTIFTTDAGKNYIVTGFLLRSTIASGAAHTPTFEVITDASTSSKMLVSTQQTGEFGSVTNKYQTFVIRAASAGDTLVVPPSTAVRINCTVTSTDPLTCSAEIQGYYQ